MSIIIHGLNMPKNEELWIRIQPDGKIVSQTGYVIEDASAEQLPPHGRLIDADAIPYTKAIWACDDYVDRYTISEMPTIIEAEGESE